MDPRVFLLSPARLGGPRSDLLLRPEANFELAVRLRRGEATIGEIYAFVSGLYFRGKVAYVAAFGSAPVPAPPAMVIVPGLGLVPPGAIVDPEQIRKLGEFSIERDTARHRTALVRDALLVDQAAGRDCRFVLLGSIATDKYTQPLLDVFGDRLLFPADFVGRGDMSRGGLMLRCASSGEELAYIPVKGAVRHGSRPPKLAPIRKK